MRPDGTLERPDQLGASIETNTGPTGRAFCSADLVKLYDYIEEGLRYYQGWYYPHPLDPWSGYMPYAWYLHQGAKLRNIENNDIYTIVEVPKIGNRATGYVRLTGNVAPIRTDRLVFENPDGDLSATKDTETGLYDGYKSKANEVMFMYAYPKTFAAPYSFNANGVLIDQGDFTNTVTFSVARQEPGTREGSPFKGTRDLRSKFRASGNWAGDDRYGSETRGQWFDNMVQFDCWAKTNQTSNELIEWFQLFMSLFRTVFEANGINLVIYWARRSDGMTTRWRDDIVYRSCTYYVRTEDVTVTAQKKIQSIFVTAGLGACTGDFDPCEFFLTGWDPQGTGIDGSIPAEIYQS